MPIKTSKQIILRDQHMASFENPVNEWGMVVDKTMKYFPCDYDPFVVWKSPLYSQTDMNYFYNSQRMLKEDETRVRLLMKKHFGEAGDAYFERTPEQIEQFLRDYSGNPSLILVFVKQAPKLAGGELWIFDVKK